MSETANIVDNEKMFGQSSTSWVIDMSSSADVNHLPEEQLCVEKPASRNNKKSSCFFVDLGDLDNARPATVKKITKKPKDINSKSVNIPYQENKDLFMRIFSNNSLAMSTPYGLNHGTYSADTNCRITRADGKIMDSCESDLGKQLLRFFLEDIGTDVTIEVSGRRIRAHKRILSSRCQYFAGLLAGGYVESAGNIIVLPSFSFNTTHFALCHIYSGVSNIPESLAILELAALADLLCLDGLKDSIAYTFQTQYCHNFHKPCSGCTSGVLECFPLTYTYNLEELSIKCVQWITTYFYIIWRTEAFGSLPKYLIDKCYQQHIKQFNLNNFLRTLHGCALTARGLQSGRWADDVFNMSRRLVADIAKLVAVNLAEALQIIILDVVNIPHESVQIVQECVAHAIMVASIEQTCLSYQYLTEAIKVITMTQVGVWYKIIKKWQKLCEGRLISGAPETVITKAFKKLPDQLKLKLRELGCIEFVPYPTNLSRETKAIKKSFEYVRAAFVPYSERPKVNLEVVKQSPIPKSSPAFTVRMTRAQLERMKFNRVNRTDDRNLGVSNQSNNKFINTKSRYLEPPARRHMDSSSIISSSEESSSVPSSRVRKNASRSTLQPLPMSEAISQDSLLTPQQSTVSNSTTTSNRFATFTKSKSPNRVYVPAPPHVKKPGSTKIPVSQMYFNRRESPKCQTLIKIPVHQASKKPSRPQEYISPRLLSTTKSSAAKASCAQTNTITVKRVSNAQTNTSKKRIEAKAVSKIANNQIQTNEKKIPKMERSGTFSKDKEF